MGKHCCIFECCSSQTSNPRPKLHTIPAATDRLSQWIEIITKYAGFSSFSEHSVVCSLHFSEDSYQEGRLSKTAVPNLFGRKRKEIVDWKILKKEKRTRIEDGKLSISNFIFQTNK